MATTTTEVTSAAELERRRLARQAAQARTGAQAQAAEARAETEAQAQEAITKTTSQAMAAKAEAREEAETRQAEIRKARGQVEREAEAAKAKARKARAKEQRKVVLPMSKPRALGIGAYIADVEAARKQAQRAGADATNAVARVRDKYFSEVDKARDKAVASVQKQKAGIIADIQTQLLNYNAEVNKQVAELNSGVSVWEARGKLAIEKAQSDYEKALKASLDRSGTDVFADMKDKGLIPENAIYGSYDKATGQLDYTIPDMRSGEEIFADLQGQNKIPPTAKYEGYDPESGQVSFKVETPNFGVHIFENMQNAGTIPDEATFVKYDGDDRTITYFVEGQGVTTVDEPRAGPAASGSGTTTTGGSTTLAGAQNSTNVVGAAAGTAAMATMVLTIAGTTAAIPTPPTWVAGGLIAAIAGAIYIYAERERIGTWIRNHLPGAKQPSTPSEVNQATDAVVTTNDGTVSYSLGQYTLTPEAKGETTTSVPMEPAKPADIKDYLPRITPLEEKVILEQERIAPAGIPMTKEQPVVMIRDRFNVPELNQKASNVLQAAVATQTVAADIETLHRLMDVRARVLSGEDYRTLEKIRATYIPTKRKAKDLESVFWYEGRTRGRRQWFTPEKAAEYDAQRKAAIEEITKAADTEYERKKAILEDARKAYVASLNPQPMKGRGSNKATAAAIGLWLAQDIIRSEIEKSLAKGDSLKTAMTNAHTKVQEMAQQLGLTQQQVDSATATVVQQVAQAAMNQAAVQAAAQVQTQTLPATETQTQTLTQTQTQTLTQTTEAAKTAAKEVVRTAVDTKTLTLSQATELARVLDQAAEYTAEMTLRVKLPKLPGLETEGKGKEYPAGTIAWKHGETERGDEYKIIPPPYTMKKPISSKYPPKGMTKTQGTPQQTLTFIGGKVPFNNVSFDLGVVDGFIDVKARKIRFTGEGQKTNVGTRIESTTRGVALVHNPPQFSRSKNGRSLLRSKGVYTDKKNTRISRRPRRGWKRIY